MSIMTTLNHLASTFARRPPGEVWRLDDEPIARFVIEGGELIFHTQQDDGTPIDNYDFSVRCIDNVCTRTDGSVGIYFDDASEVSITVFSPVRMTEADIDPEAKLVHKLAAAHDELDRLIVRATVLGVELERVIKTAKATPLGDAAGVEARMAMHELALARQGLRAAFDSVGTAMITALKQGV